MGIIQNAINQMIGTAAVAARLDPGVEERTEKRALKKDIGRLHKVSEQLEEVGATEKDVPHLEEQVTKTDEWLAGKYEKLAQLEPTQENIEAIYRHKQYVENMKKANQQAAERQENQRKQKENFKNFTTYITNIGETDETGGITNGK